jgi:signal transduction histidine kinase
MTDNFSRPTTGRSITLDARHGQAPAESLDRLRLEVAELRASRERLVLAADAERRGLERDLHQGVQQQLVALAVNLQLARELAGTDPSASEALLAEMQQHLQDALDETARLAQRIYPPLLEQGGLAAALRSAAAGAGLPARIDVGATAGCLPEVAGAVYFSSLDALEQLAAGAKATVSVRDVGGTLAFEVVADGADDTAASEGAVDRIRDRVEALGGQLTVQSEPGRGLHLSGSIPLSR